MPSTLHRTRYCAGHGNGGYDGEEVPVVEVLSDVMSNAVGIAISPIPIIATIVILFTPAARSNGPAFLVGWALGIAVTVGLFAVVGPLANDDDPGTVAGVVKLAFGALFLALAWRQWNGRPREGDEPKTPAMLAALDGCTAPKALGIGFAISVINPKNLGLSGAAGSTIGAADLSTGSAVVAVLAVVLIGALTVAIPVVAHLVAADRVAPLLRSAQAWLTTHNLAIMLVLFLVLGTRLLSDGLRILI